MRVLVLSDLHLEYEPYVAEVAPDAMDVVVLAGDIGQATLALYQARRLFPHHPIVQVAGNHEFFGGVMGPALAAMRRVAERLDIHFLECDSVTLQGVEFFGTTLWTDFRLHQQPGRPVSMSAEAAMACAVPRMWDYRRIEVYEPTATAGQRLMQPADSVRWHTFARGWLAKSLARPAQGPRVVVTHHLPSWHSVAPDYLAEDSNPAFASDLDDLVAQADLWIHGHTHSSHDYLLAGCRVISNPRGYRYRTGQFENPCFDPGRIVSL